MKQLIVIIGPNGVGKTTTAKKIVEQYENVAYVDSDWCRVMNPFAFTESTKDTITENVTISVPKSVANKETVEQNTKLPRSVYSGDKKYYDFNLEEKNGNTNVNYSYKHSIDDYGKSNFISYCYGNNSITNETDKIIINTPNRFNCIEMEDGFYMDVVTVHIKTDLKVLDNNADRVDSNIYTWTFNKSDYENKSIQMIIDKSGFIGQINQFENNPLPIIILGLLIIGFIIFIIVRILKTKHNTI